VLTLPSLWNRTAWAAIHLVIRELALIPAPRFFLLSERHAGFIRPTLAAALPRLLSQQTWGGVHFGTDEATVRKENGKALTKAAADKYRPPFQGLEGEYVSILSASLPPQPWRSSIFPP